MKKFIFTIRIFDKKLVLTLVFGIIQILKDLINNKFLKNLQHVQLTNIGARIGQILIIIIIITYFHFLI